MTSFRIRLALLVGASTAALLLAAAFLAWNFTSDLNVERLDRDLQQLARANLGRVADASHWGRLDAAFGVASGRDNAASYLVWVRNYDRVVYRSAGWPEGLKPEDFPPAETYEGGRIITEPPPPPRREGLSARNRPLPIRDPRFLVRSAGGSDWRLLVTGNPYTTLVLAANLDDSKQDLLRLRQRFIAVLPLILLVVGLAAWWLATRALRPVAALTRAAEGITAQGLDQRISAPAHDREFERLVTVFNGMLDRLEQSFHQARRFSADASHELKTPLALLQAELEQALNASPPGSSQQQLCSSLLDEIHRLKAILEKLLLLSLADSGRLTLERSETDLAAVAADVLEDCTALDPGLTIERELANGVIVAADRVLLEQALHNLLGNAVKYNRPGGIIRVSLARRGELAELRVGNTGPGLGENDRQRLFERFYRGDPARTRGRAGGTGLGLSLSREILRAHGGDLVLGRSESDYTEFIASLPAAPGMA
jgi:two-component system, OmpR family, heavy metal sensor histidine kinase CusS